MNASGAFASGFPCTSVDQRLSPAEAKRLSQIVTSTTSVPKSKVTKSYRFGAWRIFLAESETTDPGYLFFNELNGHLRYLGSWGVGGHVSDSGLMDYVVLFQEFPGIPRQLATCFTWGVIYDKANPSDTSTKSASPNPKDWQDWTAVSSSADGMRLAAVARGHGIWISKNGGDTWEQVTPTTDSREILWVSVSSSADGSVLLAAAMHGPLRLSTDSGTTWKDISPKQSSSEWVSVAVSADGKMLYATALDNLWTSQDLGSKWRRHTVLKRGKKQDNWRSIVASSDGTRLVAVALESGIWTSADSGNSWVHRNPNSAKAATPWTAVAISSDGKRLAATQASGGDLGFGGFRYVLEQSLFLAQKLYRAMEFHRHFNRW